MNKYAVYLQRLVTSAAKMGISNPMWRSRARLGGLHFPFRKALRPFMSATLSVPGKFATAAYRAIQIKPTFDACIKKKYVKQQ